MTDAYRFVGDRLPELHEPTLVVMLTGWIDASGAAAAAMATLESECNASTIAVFDGDTYIDYRARRPTMELRDGVNTGLAWPDIEVKAGVDVLGRDTVLLTGPEPDMAWRRFGNEVAGLARVLGVTRMVALGAYPFATPHTRPSRLSISAPSADLVAELTMLKNSVDVPAGVAAVLEHTLHDIAIDAIGLWVQVPHYVASMAFPAATVALLAGLAEVGRVQVDNAAARRETIIQRERLDELVAGNDEHAAMVRQLESLYDAVSDAGNSGAGFTGTGNFANGNSDGPLTDSRMPTADELGAEFERFLRDQPNG